MLAGTPTQLPPYDVRSSGAWLNNSTDDTAAIKSALTAATVTIGTALGGGISLPTGSALVSSMISLPNRVRVLGLNKRGSEFTAWSGWATGSAWNSGTAYAVGAYATLSGNLYVCTVANTNNTPPNASFWLLISPAVFYANNGFTAGVGNSMFDSTLENLTIDCNNVAGLGGVLASAWQEDCGLRGVLIQNFATYGVRLQDGFGGASLCKIIDAEIFGGTASTGATGIDLPQLSIVGGFQLEVSNTSITGLDAGHALAKCINVVNDSLQCHSVHFEYCTTGIYIAGVGNTLVIGGTGSPTVTTLLEVDSNYTGTLLMVGCTRNGATNFIKDNRVKQIASLGAITPGSAYTNGSYTSVPLTGGTGSGATANITVAGAVVTAVTIILPGTNYTAADSLSALAANIGGTGSGFAVAVGSTFTGLGTITGTDRSILSIGNPFSNSQFGGGVIDISAPVSGTTLALHGISGNNVLTVDTPSGAAFAIAVDANTGYFGTTNNKQLVFLMNNNIVGSVSTAKLWNINAPASGNQGLIVNGVTGTHSMQHSDSAAANFNTGFLEEIVGNHATPYTAVLADSGKTLYYNGTGAAAFTIPANASVVYPVGTKLHFVNDATGATNMTIAITTDTMILSPGGTAGSRTLAQFGRATAKKLTATRWIIWGSGLT